MSIIACVCLVALAAHGALLSTARPSQSTDPAVDGGVVARATTAARDPFVPPVAAPDDTPAPIAPVPRPAGPAGLSIDEMVLRGVLLAGGRHVALVQGPGTKQFAIRPGDRVRDGSVEAVLVDAVVMKADPVAPGEQIIRQVRISRRRAAEGR